ncbi:MAG: Rrf2 family transcriptional regulator [Deltaproteobacteria bacterium]|nr:Rrf2 family transcriptional regulator [Deltaproteobacteria bacterium]
MLKLSKKVDYGLILLGELGQGNGREQSSAREMALRHKLPPHMAANILKALAAAGLVTSVRGAQGGYQLGRPAEQITLSQIVEALEGPVNLVDCVGTGTGCDLTLSCPTMKPMRVVQRRFQLFMDTLTLAEIIFGREDPTLDPKAHENAHLPG